MLWVIMWVSAIMFGVNLVEFVGWGIRYVNVEILHRSGIVLHNFERYGEYALYALIVMVICIILLNNIRKRFYTICCPPKKYQILKYEEKDETFFSERSYLITYENDGELIHIKCPESATKESVLDEEKPYIIISKEIWKTPSMLETVLTLYLGESEKYEIKIPPTML